jgi:hypothetical protein
MQMNFWDMLWRTALLFLLPVITLAQHEQPGRTLTIEGRAGQAAVVEIGGRTYVDVEGLKQITHGSLTFNANRIILTLPMSIVNPPSTEHSPVPAHSSLSNSELSREFMRAGIEEFATMREWASTLSYAIDNGYQVTESWAANYREQAARNLTLASAAASTESDRKALQLLTNEFEAVREWSNRLVQERRSMDTAKYALSPNALRDDSQSQKIIACGRFLATMLGSGSFQDDPSCH